MQSIDVIIYFFDKKVKDYSNGELEVQPPSPGSPQEDQEAMVVDVPEQKKKKLSTDQQPKIAEEQEKPTGQDSKATAQQAAANSSNRRGVSLFLLYVEGIYISTKFVSN